MRKWNNILARIIIVLLLLHALMGCLILLGISNVSIVRLPKILLAAVGIHGILGIMATIPSIKSGIKTGRWYFKENAAFWTKRISGLAILLLLTFHITAYTTNMNGHFFLKEFTVCGLISQILFIGAIFIHLAVSIRSMLIAKGTVKFKERTVDWMLVLSVMMILFTAAIILYFIQWQV